MDRVLEVKNLKYAYSRDSIVFKNINVNLEEGKIYSILGHSGSGKTTFLSLLGGLDTPTEGEILFKGENIENYGLANHRKNNVSFIFQSYNLIDYLTPMENVSIASKLPPLPAARGATVMYASLVEVASFTAVTSPT